MNVLDDDGPQYIQCYREIAATTMDKNGKYTTINIISGHQIVAAIADDEYRIAGGW